MDHHSGTPCDLQDPCGAPYSFHVHKHIHLGLVSACSKPSCCMPCELWCRDSAVKICGSGMLALHHNAQECSANDTQKAWVSTNCLAFTTPQIYTAPPPALQLMRGFTPSFLRVSSQSLGQYCLLVSTPFIVSVCITMSAKLAVRC